MLSNVLPQETSQLCKLCMEGNYPEAMKLQAKYLPLVNALFCEVNPIPVKAAMAAMGFCEDYLRLPLTNMEPEHREVLLQCMKDAGVKF